jgi:CheY-like chemotaxis protein
MKTNDSFLPIDRTLNVLLADDDISDCRIFKVALDQLPVTVNLTTVHDGDQLINLLMNAQPKLPDVLFLDLNMPRKNGFAALGLLKRKSELLQLPVIILSTISEETKVNQVFKDAAHYYIRKPSDFSELKKVIYEALVRIVQNPGVPEKKDFVLTGVLKPPTGPMKKEPLQILLADDDDVDRMLFKTALNETEIEINFQKVNDGTQLMKYLAIIDQPLPHFLFLDLNMPLKSGLECLIEIRSNILYKDIPIAIYSTSASNRDVDETFSNGATMYIKKPNDFIELIQVLKKAILAIHTYRISPFNRANFLVTV